MSLLATAFGHRIITGTLLLGALLSGPAVAQNAVIKLKNIVGAVLVNQGEVFRNARPNHSLQIGNRIIVLSHSSAVVSKTIGATSCERELAANTHAVITDALECNRLLEQFHIDNLDQLSNETTTLSNAPLSPRLLDSPIVQCSGRSCLQALGLDEDPLPLLSPE